MKKQYRPPREIYNTCNECRFKYGKGCHFCGHPKMRKVAPILVGEAQGLLLFTDLGGGYGSDEEWEKFGFPEWCPLKNA